MDRTERISRARFGAEGILDIAEKENVLPPEASANEASEENRVTSHCTLEPLNYLSLVNGNPISLGVTRNNLNQSNDICTIHVIV
jgi:hypothetical protein